MISTLQSLIESPAILVFSRIVLTTLFWSAGIAGLIKFSMIVDEMKAASLPNPALFAAATIATQLAGSILIISNFQNLGWLGAGALIIFTLVAIPIGHPFWTRPEPRRTEEFHLVLEHITVVGGLMLAAILSFR